MEYDAGKAAIRCLYAAVGIAVLLTMVFWGEWLAVVLAWVFAMPLALVLGSLYGFVGAAFGYTPVDDEDEDEEIDVSEDPRFWVNNDDSGIVYSDAIVGKYKDANIHEWVMIDQPESNKKIKCTYETVVDMDLGFTPPDSKWFILLEPGILYVAEPKPENSVAEAAEAV